MPQGYSSLGGQVLLPVRHQQVARRLVGRVGGGGVSRSRAAGDRHGDLDRSRAADRTGGNAGVVALKPTVGLVSRAGVLPVAKSQDAPGPIGQTVDDVADALSVLAGPDPADPVTLGQPTPLPSYTDGLTSTALSGKKIAVVSSTSAPYPAAVAELKRSARAPAWSPPPRARPHRASSRMSSIATSTPTCRAPARRCRIAAADHRIQRSQLRRGSEVRPGSAAGARGGGIDRPGDDRHLRRKPGQRPGRRPRRDRRDPQSRLFGDHGAERQLAGRASPTAPATRC